jgi:predicted nucleic acid-binding protein
MNPFTVLVDSCVLYSASLRDLVIHLALVGLFRARWTERIHKEWIRSVLRNRPDLKREPLERTRTLMDTHVQDALVTGYEPLIEGLVLPDPDDRHVLAAAIRCNADLILTFNLDDFPRPVLSPFGIEAQHPDEFLLNQLSLDQAKVLTALKRQRESLKQPPMRSLDFFDTLRQQQLPQFVSELQRYADVL